MTMQDKRLMAIVITAFVILSIPFFAMQFTNEVDWDGRDFLIMGVLLLGTGLSIEWMLRRVKDNWKRLLYAGVILFILFLIWAELAVGIFGSPFAGS